MPYDWTVHTAPSGVTLASQNCLQCHVGRFNGELVMGLGVADRDFTTSQADTFGAIPIPELGVGGLGELTKFLHRVGGLGPNTVMRTIGSNPAEMAAISLVAHRDPDTLAWSDDPWFDVPAVPVPSDVPPWWRAAKKNALFYNAMARGDHRGTMILATALCTDEVAEAELIAEEFSDIHAFVRSLQAPAYPFAIDAELAEAGEAVFETDCAPCHGTYAADPAAETFPNLLLPLDVIGTDPVVAEGGTLWAPELVEWYSQSVYGSITRMVVDDPFLGYLAPPLDGVWATGPFLHNGSVPNLALLLDSTKRPTFWRRVDYDSTHFDEVNLGWPYLEVSDGQDVLPPQEAKHVYDTTQFGHHATGHTFGDHLSPVERAAVLEYLKTL
jgi:mono/diheme cytochrome c family protein